MIKQIKGVENIPNKAPFIIVANHEYHIDVLYIIYPILKKLNKKVHFISNPRLWFLGETICRKWAGCIPLFSSRQAYQEAKEKIESGGIVGIFPEGTAQRTKDPKTGAVRLALGTKTPILPIGLKSSHKPFNSKLNIGKLIYVKKNKDIKKQTLDIMQYFYKLKEDVD